MERFCDGNIFIEWRVEKLMKKVHTRYDGKELCTCRSTSKLCVRESSKINNFNKCQPRNLLSRLRKVFGNHIVIDGGSLWFLMICSCLLTFIGTGSC